jgi:membrane protease YdiL (CAAX protease family)
MKMQESVPKETIPPDSVPWKIRDVRFAMAFLVLFILLEFATIYVVGSQTIRRIYGQYATFFELILLVPVAWFTFFKYRSRWKGLGFRSFKGITVGIGCGFYALFFAVNILYSILLNILKIAPSVNWVAVFENISSPWWLLAAGILLAPFVEEIFFRGFVFSGLNQRLGWVKAMLISAAVFSFVHLQITNMIPIFLLGCILAYLYHYSKSIWPSIILHAIANFISMSLALIVANLH